MAARKDPEDRVRRNKPVEKEPLPEWDGIRRGFSLQSRDMNISWHPSTVFWWDRWRESPQAMFTTDVDWESLYVAAILHNNIMHGCSHTAMAALTGELRKREDAFGASPLARQQLNVGNGSKSKVDIQESEIEKGVREAVDYVARVAKAMKDNNNPGG